ncbi:Pollike protein [Globisporangium polare]
MALPRNTEWRATWRESAQRVTAPRLTDAVFAAAEHVFIDPLRTADDRKAAALRGTPPAVPADTCFPMWIPAKFLTATFSDTEIMTSLGSDQQPPVWNSSVPFLRDFKCIRNAGISFTCVDREICTKLGNLLLTICGKEFTVQPYSKYSHWYYVDLQRLPDDVTDELIYDWFLAHGTPPVYITPAQVVNGLQSRSRRVYFNQKAPPASLMINPKTPIREIEFSASGFAVVHHRNRAFNKEMPPFLQAIKRKQAAGTTARKGERGISSSATKPATQPSKGAPGNEAPPTPALPDDPGLDVEINTDGDDDDSNDSMSDNDGSDDSDEAPLTRPRVSPTSVWTTTARATKFPATILSVAKTDFSRIQNSKRMFFPSMQAASATDLAQLLVGSEYPWSASPNSFELLATGDLVDPISPDFDAVVLNGNKQMIKSTIQRTNTAKLVLASQYASYEVNEMTLDAVCAFLEKFNEKFVENSDPEVKLATIQAQPAIMRSFYDTASPKNYDLLRPTIMEHAAMRIVGRTAVECDGTSFSERVLALFPGENLQDPQTLLTKLTGSMEAFWLQVYIAELDLLLQTMAPSVYFDSIKVAELIRASPSVLGFTLWHLWDDRTLEAILRSPLLASMLQANLPEEVRDHIQELLKLQQNAAPVSGHAL